MDDLAREILEGRGEVWWGMWSARAHHLVPDTPWVEAALRARLAGVCGRPDPFLTAGIPGLSTLEERRLDAWTRSEEALPGLDGAWAGLLAEGQMLCHAIDTVAGACWARGRADLIRPLGEWLCALVAAVADAGTGRTHPSAWGDEQARVTMHGPRLRELRHLRLPSDADNALALILWRSGQAHVVSDKPLAVRMSDAYLAEMFDGAFVLHSAPGAGGVPGAGPKRKHVHLQRQARCVESGRGYLQHLRFGVDAAERLRIARGECSVEPAARTAREARAWRRSGGRTDHVGQTTAALSVAEFTRRACRALWDLASVGAADDAAGRELLVPVDWPTLTALVATHLRRDHCEGLHLVRATGGTRGINSGPRCYLALGFVHEDPEGGRRRVSAYWHDRDENYWSEGWALHQLTQLNFGPEGLGRESSWDDTTSWLGAVHRPAGPPAVHLFPLATCGHTRWQWNHRADDPGGWGDGGHVAEARCARCERPMLRAHTWQLVPEVALAEPRALARARWWAVINGEDPEAVTDSLAAIRARDPQVAAQPTRAGTGNMRSLRDTLAGR